MFLAWGPGPSYIKQMVPSKIASLNEKAFAIHEHSWCPFLLLLMFCLSGVPLCGQRAWWIRQTPSGLGCSLVLMKIKSIIFQKIKRSGSPGWSLLPSLLSAWWSAWESSSMSQAWPMIWLPQGPRAMSKLTSSSIWFLNSHLGIDPVQIWGSCWCFARKTGRQRLRKDSHYFG